PAARGLPPDDTNVNAGVCAVRQTWGVDNTFTTIRCAAGDQEVVYHRSGSGFAGYWCEWRVLGEDRPELCMP
ncbi:MAG TPA: hypothetical protein VHH36_02545, partial [Candidatus Thermoplasmatota archaeon]|nr:hypothetical protein [Candidatus Thermoplasmatota archaeon]